jgi:hypothetical protein
VACETFPSNLAGDCHRCLPPLRRPRHPHVGMTVISERLACGGPSPAWETGLWRQNSREPKARRSAGFRGDHRPW